MMDNIRWIVVSLSLLSLLSLLSASQLHAEIDSSFGLLLKTRQDIDYRLNNVGVSVSLLTPIGLFRCDPGYLTGETRIDSFNNIVGISDVREAEWKDFSARDLECRYGAKWQAGDGVLKAGFGLRDYQGNTHDEPGGKDISIEGAGALLDYDSDRFDARLEWKREIHDYTLMHQSAFINYDSLIDATEDTYRALGTYGYLYLSAEHVTGNKDNVYTTPLFPANEFHYDFTDVSLGIRFEPAFNGVTVIAPVFGRGSYRGSFNPLTGDSGLNGVQLAGLINGYSVDLKVVQHDGEGNRPYLPATENLTEEQDSTTISLGIDKDDWHITLENTSFTHTANATIADPLYAAILGGYGPYDNKREEDKWTLSASFPVRHDITADLSFYHTSRQDRQYNHPEHNYTEKGGLIRLTISE